MKEKLQAILEQALKELDSVSAKENLENARIKYLGKKGELTAILRGMGDSVSPLIFLLIACGIACLKDRR